VVEDVAVRERRLPATEKLVAYFASRHLRPLSYQDLISNRRVIDSGAAAGQPTS
jgi:hypothetical protein